MFLELCLEGQYQYIQKDFLRKMFLDDQESLRVSLKLTFWHTFEGQEALQ